MPLLSTQNKGHKWSLQVACSCHMFVENPKCVFKGSPSCVECVCQMSNFIHLHDFHFILLLSTHCLFFLSMIVHDHVNVKYAHHGLDFYPSGTNHTVGSFAKPLRDLEKPPIHSSRVFFYDFKTTSLYMVVY